MTKKELDGKQWYNTMSLNGYITDGAYDWRPYFDMFKFGNLQGKRVLDVGAGDGYFSFEFEDLGAEVIALEIPAQLDRDSSLYGKGTIKETRKVGALLEFEDKFAVAARILGSQVKYIPMDIYDLDPKVLGKFDLVFCNDVLLHLTDPLRALAKMHNVCSGELIVGTPIIRSPLIGRKAVALFIGNITGAFWKPTSECFEELVIAAGFSEAKTIAKFKMKPEHSKYNIGLRGIVRGKIHSDDGFAERDKFCDYSRGLLGR